MSWTERIEWLVLGMMIGSILGYMVRYLREIKEELDEVKELEQEHIAEDRARNESRKRDESGLTRRPIILDIVLFLVVVMTVYAAFSSQKANNELDDVSDCNVDFLGGTLSSLDERSTYTVDSTQANLKLQTSQAEFFSLILQDPQPPEKVRRKAAVKYFVSLTEFVQKTSDATNSLQNNPYPSVGAYRACLHN